VSVIRATLFARHYPRNIIRATLSAQLGQQVSGVDRLGENLEFMAMHAGVLQQIDRGGLT
jgi:hypothetical protein